MSHLKFVFDHFPDHNGFRFIEVEDERGKSLRAGEWRGRQDGLVEFVVPVDGDLVMLEERLLASEARCAALQRIIDLNPCGGGDCGGDPDECEKNEGYGCDCTPAKNAVGKAQCPDCGHDNVLCACGYKS